MKFSTTAALIVGVAIVTNDLRGADEVKLESLAQKASYVIGRNIGGQMARDGVEIDAAALVRGISDALAGKDSVLSREEMQAAIQAFQHEMMAKRQKVQEASSAKNKEEGEAFLKKNGKAEGVVTTASGLQYKIIKEGKGDKPTASSTVTCHYHGTLIDGTVFDSSVERGETIDFPVNGVIKGWTEALQLMPVGSKWKLFIPGDLAYGSRGAGEKIGPHATLIFEVELIGIK